MATEYVVQRGEQSRTVTVVADQGDRAVLQLGEQRLEVAVQTLPDGRIALVDAHGRHVYRVVADRQGPLVVAGPVQHAFAVQDAREQWLRGAGGGKGAAGGRVTASMPGRVVRVPVAVGDVVPPGAVVAVLEAMKMENDVRAPGGGRVVAVAVREGAAVEAGALLVQLEAEA